MPTVSVPGAYIRNWVGGGTQIGRTVGFERAATALRLAGGTFARNAALAGTGYLGAGVAAASLAYEGYQMYRRRNKRSGSALSRPTKKARKSVKYGTTGRRKGVGKRYVARRRFVGNRAKAYKRVSGGRSRMGMRRTRKYNSLYSLPEFGLPTRLTCKVGPGNRIKKHELKLGYQKIISRWQRVNQLSDPTTGIPGSMYFVNYALGTDSATPCYLFNLNQVQNGSVTYTNGPMYRLDFNDTGNVVLSPQVSQTNAGVLAANGNWQIESYDPERTGESVRYIMNAWYDIRLMLHGAKAQPTVFDIMVVSFTRGYLDPLETPSNAQEAADRHSLYQGLVQPYMSNPIMPRMRSVQGYRIHKRLRVCVDPTLNVEDDPDPKCKDVRLFIKDGSVYDYRYHGDGFSGAGADDKLVTVQWPVQGVNNTDYSNVTAPMARKYLIIRAMNTTRTGAGIEQNVSNTPSMDIIIRKGEYQQDGN